MTKGLDVPVFAVLLVCTGNQCRSPAAAALLDAQLRSAPRRAVSFDLASAGTAVTAPRPMHPLTVDALKEIGLAMPGHESQPLTAELVQAADLVLTAERQHRVAVADLVSAVDPTAARRTFTMLEFATAVSVVAPLMDPTLGPAPMSLGRLMTPRELVFACGARRPAAGPDLDISDPIGGTLPAHREVVDTLAWCMTTIGSVLASLAVLTRPSKAHP